jgi:hypothetical protein
MRLGVLLGGAAPLDTVALAVEASRQADSHDEIIIPKDGRTSIRP